MSAHNVRLSYIGGDRMDFTTMLEQLSGGMLESIKIFIFTLIFSLPLGLLVAFGRMSKIALIRNIVKVYISIMRGTPLMLQLLAVFYGPFYLWGADIGNRFIAIILGFSLNYAAYFAEIYRSGIESMPLGQYEAAKLLGYNKVQTFIKIILPQVIKRILPSVTNEVITLVKDTSLAFVLVYMELFSIAKQISAAQTTFMPFVIAGVFYYVFNFIVAMFMELAEKKLSYYR